MIKNGPYKTSRIIKRTALLLAIIISASFIFVTNIHAITSISQSYATSEDLPLGSIVSLKNNTTDQVVSTTTNNADEMLGVVINDDSSLLALSSDKANQVQVATSGSVVVLVSDINGNVLKGDHITASPIRGVSMKATGNSKTIGIAQGDTRDGTKQTYKDKSGKEQTVTLGNTTVVVNVAYYFKQPEKTLVPTALQNVANALAAKKVEPLPIIISLAIFIITMVVVVTIIFSMIRSSIISVGRNPMSQSAIYRDLIQLSALVLAILSVGFISIYLVLTRM